MSIYLFLSHRNVKYTINGHHRDHITVYADVVPVALELSTELLDLTPTPGMPAEAGRLTTSTLSLFLSFLLACFCVGGWGVGGRVIM